MKRPVVSIRILFSFQTLKPQGGPAGRRTFWNVGEQVLGFPEGLLPLLGSDHEDRTHAVDLPLERLQASDAAAGVDERVAGAMVLSG